VIIIPIIKRTIESSISENAFFFIFFVLNQVRTQHF
jgi:hypothetical protein